MGKTNRGRLRSQSLRPVKRLRPQRPQTPSQKIPEKELCKLTCLHEERKAQSQGWEGLPVRWCPHKTWVAPQDPGHSVIYMDPGQGLVMSFSLLSDLPFSFLFLPSLFLFFYCYDNYQNIGAKQIPNSMLSVQFANKTLRTFFLTLLAFSVLF